MMEMWYSDLVLAILAVMVIVAAGGMIVRHRRRGRGGASGDAAAAVGLSLLPLAVVETDAEGRCRLFNQAATELFGGAAKIGCHLGELLTWPASAGDPMAAALAGATVAVDAEVPATGRCLPLTLVPRRDAAGRLLGVLLVGAPELGAATERRLIGEATTRAILDAAVDGIITIDETGHITSFNRAAEHIFGYREAEVIGQDVGMLMPEPYRSAHGDYLRQYLDTGEGRIIGIGREVVGLRHDGSVFPMDLAVGESRTDGRRIFAGIVRDITRRKETEARLRQSEERFRLVVEGARDYAISILDTEGRIVSWNAGGERIGGWTAAEIVGRDFSCFYLPEAVAAGEPQQAIDAVREKGWFEEEGWRLRKSGERFWAHIAMTPLRDQHGNLTGYVRVGRDMTESKKAEEALRRAKEDAERAREEAERANLAKSKFLAAASHDLRQPVQALFFFVSALSRKLRGHPAWDVLADMERSLDALNMLLESLLDISKLDAGVILPKETTFSVSSLLERMEAEQGPAARHKGLTLKVVPCSAMIRSDPALLSRLLQNLVANAVRYTRKGRILVGCRRHGSRLALEVWDTGIGIPEDRLGEIFDEFYQVGNAERDRNQGLGLGLAIVDRIARLLDHRVTVRSRFGHGSVFRVEVPCAAEQRPNPQRRWADDREAHGQRGLVLVIDDEATVLKGLSLVLEEWGYTVIAVTSEEEAITALQGRGLTPDAILADYRLRDGKTGTDAIAHIRGLLHQPIPSILITGDTAPERLREAEASGLSILHKPVNPPQLHSLLEDSIGRLESAGQKAARSH